MLVFGDDFSNTFLDRLQEITLPEPVAIQRFVERSGDPELSVITSVLIRVAYGPPGADAGTASWSGRRFIRLVARARNALLSGDDHQQLKPWWLPPLNP